MSGRPPHLPTRGTGRAPRPWSSGSAMVRERLSDGIALLAAILLVGGLASRVGSEFPSPWRHPPSRARPTSSSRSPPTSWRWPRATAGRASPSPSSPAAPSTSAMVVRSSSCPTRTIRAPSPISSPRCTSAARWPTAWSPPTATSFGLGPDKFRYLYKGACKVGYYLGWLNLFVATNPDARTIDTAFQTGPKYIENLKRNPC